MSLPPPPSLVVCTRAKVYLHRAVLARRPAYAFIIVVVVIVVVYTFVANEFFFLSLLFPPSADVSVIDYDSNVGVRLTTLVV